MISCLSHFFMLRLKNTNFDKLLFHKINDNYNSSSFLS